MGRLNYLNNLKGRLQPLVAKLLKLRANYKRKHLEYSFKKVKGVNTVLKRERRYHE